MKHCISLVTARMDRVWNSIHPTNAHCISQDRVRVDRVLLPFHDHPTIEQWKSQGRIGMDRALLRRMSNLNSWNTLTLFSWGGGGTKHHTRTKTNTLWLKLESSRQLSLERRQGTGRGSLRGQAVAVEDCARKGQTKDRK